MEYEFIPLCSDNIVEFAPVHVSAFSVDPWREVWSVQAAEERLSTISRFPHFEGLAIQIEGTPVAFVLGWAERGANHWVFYIKDMCVTSDRQRQGLGSALLAEFEMRLRQSKFSGAYLQTRDDAPAMKFYDAVGFKVFGAASLGKRFQYDRHSLNENQSEL